MKLAIHAVGRPEDVLPFLALGAQVHEAMDAAAAKALVHKLDEKPGTLILLTEEFGAAAAEAKQALVVVIAGAAGGTGETLDKVRNVVARSLGVDLIAKADKDRTER